VSAKIRTGHNINAIQRLHSTNFFGNMASDNFYPRSRLAENKESDVKFNLRIEVKWQGILLHQNELSRAMCHVGHKNAGSDLQYTLSAVISFKCPTAPSPPPPSFRSDLPACVGNDIHCVASVGLDNLTKFGFGTFWFSKSCFGPVRSWQCRFCCYGTAKYFHRFRYAQPFSDGLLLSSGG
jgi:hypothetical protein